MPMSFNHIASLLGTRKQIVCWCQQMELDTIYTQNAHPSSAYTHTNTYTHTNIVVIMFTMLNFENTNC